MKHKRINIAIDYGNSSAKVGIFHDEDPAETRVYAVADELRQFLQNFSGAALIISSVSMDASTVAAWAKNIATRFILTKDLPLPIQNRYATPDTLGVDRIAGACGARAMFPGVPCLVIDAGTCITYDLIDDRANFLGGGISPGLRMRFQAVHAFTKRLPLVEPVETAPLVGNSTETCIQSGVINGVVAEIEGIITEYQRNFADLRVILTGGDTAFFENKLKASIFAVPELVLSGLNSILIHNARSK